LTQLPCLQHHPPAHIISPFLPCTHPPPPQTYTLSLHDALPISNRSRSPCAPRISSRLITGNIACAARMLGSPGGRAAQHPRRARDRKSTRLNSSHQIISYAVFCLKKKKNQTT